MKLIVGLGNPGKEYQNTRHNVGFMVLDHYINSSDWKEKFHALYHEERINGEKIIFVKPLTYMNLSGNAVVKFVDYFNVNNEDILVVQDDLDLPYLKYKLKYKSSSGGHNGIKSIIQSLGTNEIPRLKIGIANNKNIDTKDYVLGKFSKKDLEEFKILCKTFDDIINLFINENIDACMQKYNYK